MCSYCMQCCRPLGPSQLVLHQFLYCAGPAGLDGCLSRLQKQRGTLEDFPCYKPNYLQLENIFLKVMYVICNILSCYVFLDGKSNSPFEFIKFLYV